MLALLAFSVLGFCSRVAPIDPHSSSRIKYLTQSYTRPTRSNLVTSFDAVYLLRALAQANFKVSPKSELSLPVYNAYEVQGNFVDVTCGKNKKEFEKVRKFRDVWLVWGGDLSSKSRLDSDLVLATPGGGLLDLSETALPAGSWDPPTPSLPDRRRRFDLGGRTLVGAFLNIGLKFDEKNKFKEISDNYVFPNMEVPQRFSFVLCHALSDFYNFRLETREVDTWGLPQENGSFSGMIGLLDRGEGDLGTFGCEMREERFGVVLFLQPLQNLRFVFFFLEERAVGTYKALLMPFTPAAWACTAVFVVLGGLVFGRVHHGEHLHGVLFVIGVLAQQGLSVEPARPALRVLSLFLLVLSVVLYSYYSAAIMYGLLSPSPVTIRGLRQLRESPLRIAIANVPYLNFDYNQRKYVPGEMLEHIKARPNWLWDLVPGLEKVRRERFCICSDDIAIYPFVEEMFSDGEKCNIRELEMIRPFPLALPIQRDTQYFEMFSQGVVRLTENGLADRERRRWFPEKPHCLGAASFSHVSLEAVAAALICFALGLLLSLAVFTVELLQHKRTSRRAKVAWE